MDIEELKSERNSARDAASSKYTDNLVEARRIYKATLVAIDNKYAKALKIEAGK